MTLARALNRDTVPLRFKGLGRDSQLKQGRVDYCFKVHGLKKKFRFIRYQSKLIMPKNGLFAYLGIAFVHIF